MATYYISPTGNDTTGNGSSGNPWATISKAVTGSASGDVIVCASGTYTWTAQSFISNRTIVAATPGGAIFDGASATFQWRLTGSNVTVSVTGLVFQNATSPNYGSFDTGNTYTSSVWNFINCKFKNITVPTKGGVIELGYQTITPSCACTGCIFENITGNAVDRQGLFAWRSAGTGPGTFTITNCVIYISAWAVSVYVGIISGGSDMAVNVKNTIIYNAKGSALNWESIQGSPVVSYSYSDAYLMTGMPSGVGNITSDPLFVDVPNDNFALRPGSPCLDVGSL